MKKKTSRFEKISEESIGFSMSTVLLRDNETGVLYLYAGTGYGGGLTPLLDAEGKPMIQKKPLDGEQQ